MTSKMSIPSRPTTEQKERRAALFAVAAARGSRAKTWRGILPHIMDAARDYARARAEFRPDQSERRESRSQYRTRRSQERLIAHYLTAVHPDQTTETYFRWRLGERGRLPLAPELVPGSHINIVGYGYGFRWKGRWKYARGSYIPSTRQMLIGIDYWAQHGRDLRRRTIGGADTIWQNDSRRTLHGYHVYRAAFSACPCWLVTAGDPTGKSKPWACHIDSDEPEELSLREIVREAVHLRRCQRATAVSEVHPEWVWVCVDDSIAAGNCRPVTEETAKHIREMLGGDVYAVRGDVLLGYRNDMYTRRAVAAAARRAYLSNNVRWPG